MKKKMSVKVSHTALLVLSPFTTGQKVKPQKIIAGNMAHFIKGIRRPFLWVLLSLNDAIKGSNNASTNLPDAKITDRIFSTPKKSNCGTNGINPEFEGGR